MDIFSFIMLLGGLAFFLYGMTVLSSGLEKLAGEKLEKILKKMTSSKLNALLLGAGITIAIQSSSAMTVMLVGLVNSGIMELGQSIGLILGSNIGTTLTAWILALAGIDSDVIWLQFLKPENFSLVFALVGAVMIMMSKSRKRKDIGSIFVGFAVLLYGMKLMSDAVSPLADMPEFASILTAFENPLLGVLVGAIFTGIIQSSAASVGVLQALSITGNITYGMGIPIIMGQNIGTCVTALLSSIGANRSGRRVAVIHLTFNIVGTVVGLWESFLLALSDGTGQPQNTADEGQRRKEEGVKRFQQWLKDSFLRPVVVDGSFGPATKREAVGALQAELNKNYGRKLAVDGSFGPATMAAIFPLHKGHWGTLVYLLQGFLYGKGYVYGGFDGSFGLATDAEVRSFQKNNGLVVDGSAGPATWEKLVK